MLAELPASRGSAADKAEHAPLPVFYASVGVALAARHRVCTVLHFRHHTYTHDTAQSQTFVITARTRAELTPTEPTLAAAALSADEADAPEQEETVYITSHGERYHKATCFSDSGQKHTRRLHIESRRT